MKIATYLHEYNLKSKTQFWRELDYLTIAWVLGVILFLFV